MALVELAAGSLEYVLYDMTWAEFQLRLFGYERQQKVIQANFREVAWCSLFSFHSDPKKLPKSKQALWPIYQKEQKNVTNKQREAMLQAMKEYNIKKNERKVTG